MHEVVDCEGERMKKKMGELLFGILHCLAHKGLKGEVCRELGMEILMGCFEASSIPSVF